VHSAVWSLVEKETWLICVNNFFHFALKLYFISKTIRCFWFTCIPIFHVWSSGLWQRVVMWWDTNVSEGHAASIFTSLWKWRQHGHPKCWFPTTSPHPVTTQKTSTWFFMSTNVLSYSLIFSYRFHFRTLYVLKYSTTQFLINKLHHHCTRLWRRIAERKHSSTHLNFDTRWKGLDGPQSRSR
jgi:hypothetical protein